MASNVLLPWINAAGAEGERYSMQSFQGDGTTGPWEFNFAGGYIEQTHVKAYRYDPVSATTAPQTLTFIGPNQVTTSEVIPADQFVVVYRDTPKDIPLVDYVEGAIMDEENLDMTAEQAVFAAAEMVDRFDTVNATVSDAVTRAEAVLGTANDVLDSAQQAADDAAASAVAATNAAQQAQDRWHDIDTKFTVSTELPSGGKDGDIWFQVLTGDQ